MFDFSDNPLKIYGIWPQTPFPLEVSIYGYCTASCSFCFANRNRDAHGRKDNLHLTNSTPALFRKIDRCLQDETSPIGFFLREKYPICFSNTTDPFQRDEKKYRATEAFLAWSKATRTPLYIQTRGMVLHEEFERYKQLLVPGLHVVYMSICQMDDKDRKFNEPGALAIEKRWELAGMLRDHGIPVIAACNPYLKDWVPEPEKYVERAAAAGTKGIWLEYLHLTGDQADCMARPYTDLKLKANLAKMYVVGLVKKWYAATEAAGIDFFPSPYWDAYCGHRGQHPECADPKWLGGKTFDFAFQVGKIAYQTMKANPKKIVALRWCHVRWLLEQNKMPNPVLNTSDFWYPFNNQVKADREAWNARLGKAAPLYEIIRYFWNHPWENASLFWFNGLAQPVFATEDGKQYAMLDDDGDLMGVYNYKASHGHKGHFPREQLPDDTVAFGEGVLDVTGEWRLPTVAA